MNYSVVYSKQVKGLSIWFDTKQDTYLLPLKAAIRKKEQIELNEDVNISIWV